MRSLSALVLFSVLSLCAATSFFEVVVGEWEAWKAEHGKNYSNPGAEKYRMKIYMDNKARIAKHNHQAHQGRHTYFLKMNHFGDMLHSEFVQQMNGYLHGLRNAADAPRGASFIEPAHVTVPNSIDWRQKGAVTPVKNQGQCGSCWAFSTTGALEGQHYRKSGTLVSLSEQQLVDCSMSYGNHGCDGGLMDNAFKYIKENGGIDTEQSYPYEAEDDRCRYKSKDKGAGDVGFTDIPAGDEEAMKKAVATVGPVAVAIDAAQETFQFYSHGVYYDPNCDPAMLDHGVLVVGYGVYNAPDDAVKVPSDPAFNGKDYWLVKNSWGEQWGDKGYIMMARNKNNACGISSSASYPLV